MYKLIVYTCVKANTEKVNACATHHTKWTLFGACNKTWHFACLNDLCISQMFSQKVVIVCGRAKGAQKEMLPSQILRLT